MLRQLRESGARVPVLVISGRDRESLTADLAELRAAYLNKEHFSPESFHEAIAQSQALARSAG